MNTSGDQHNEIGEPAAAILLTPVESSTALQAALTSFAEQRAVKAKVATPAKRGRATSANRDGLFTRHHALCTMGAAGDLLMGGPQEARTVAEPMKMFNSLTADLPSVLLELCPWVLKPGYLNLDETADAQENGLETAFRRWAANRVYYFYRTPEHPEHPVNRTKAHVGEIYAEFYAAFSRDVEAMMVIGEERAREFWLSVADRVPFQAPAASKEGVLSDGTGAARAVISSSNEEAK